MYRKLLTLIILCAAVIPAALAQATDPAATDYSVSQCLGSKMPYPADDNRTGASPDSLTVVFVNHVGRHGSRFPSSPANYRAVRAALMRADSLGTITAKGRSLLDVTEYAEKYIDNRWGALDSLGMAEQRGIASRMYRNYPRLFDGTTVTALSSYSPRCIMSMYEFAHQLARLNNNIELLTSAGRANSPLMRPFDGDPDYLDYMQQRDWEPPYDMYMRMSVPTSVATSLLGSKYAISQDDAQDFAMAVYGVVAGWQAMGLTYNPGDYLTPRELNSLWSVSNLRRYLQRTATTLSTVPADIASALLIDLINTTDAAAAGTSAATVRLRFGHAETLIPLMSLMRVRGAHYLTNYFDTVGLHWRDFELVPMASNIQLVLFKDKSGKYVVRLDLNERPVPLMPDSDALYTPWEVAREYLLRQIPLILRP